MTEKRDIFSENDLVSATEMTGAAPRAMDEDAAETIADITNARCSPSYSAEDPSKSPRYSPRDCERGKSATKSTPAARGDSMK